MPLPQCNEDGYYQGKLATFLRKIIMTVDIARNKFALLRIVNMKRLSQRDNQEVQELLLAAKTDGMFYMDFSDFDSDLYTGVVNDVYSLSWSLFNLGLEEKLQYDIDALTDLKTNG